MFSPALGGHIEALKIRMVWHSPKCLALTAQGGYGEQTRIGLKTASQPQTAFFQQQTI